MKKLLVLVGILLIIMLLITIFSPQKVVLHNKTTNTSLTITNKGLIETLKAPLENVEKDSDRIKTPFTNTLTIYKGFIPVKRINFGMPEIFINDEYGQIIIWGKPYRIHNTFYAVLAKIEKEKNYILDTF